jgi:hypothetical protein
MPSLFTILVVALAGGGILYESRKMRRDGHHDPTQTSESSHVENQEHKKVSQVTGMVAPSGNALPRHAIFPVADSGANHDSHDPRATPVGIATVIESPPAPEYIQIARQPMIIRNTNYRSRW